MARGGGRSSSLHCVPHVQKAGCSAVHVWQPGAPTAVAAPACQQQLRPSLAPQLMGRAGTAMQPRDERRECYACSVSLQTRSAQHSPAPVPPSTKCWTTHQLLLICCARLLSSSPQPLRLRLCYRLENVWRDADVVRLLRASRRRRLLLLLLLRGGRAVGRSVPGTPAPPGATGCARLAAHAHYRRHAQHSRTCGPRVCGPL